MTNNRQTRGQTYPVVLVCTVFSQVELNFFIRWDADNNMHGRLLSLGFVVVLLLYDLSAFVVRRLQGRYDDLGDSLEAARQLNVRLLAEQETLEYVMHTLRKPNPVDGSAFTK